MCIFERPRRQQFAIHFSMFKLLKNGRSTDVAAALDVRLPTAPALLKKKDPRVQAL